jgi:Tol biopolymer transport system component
MFPFWSPDSRKIGFFTATQLERVDVSGSAPIPICRVTGARGGTWSADGTIIFAPNTQDHLYKVPASGGTPLPLTTIDSTQHTSHRWPSLLPDGNRFLYLACNHESPSGSVNAIYLGSLDGTAPRMILRSISDAVYADGYLLFARDQTLYAQKVTSDLSLDGEPVAIAHDVLYDSGIWRGAFSVSRDGLLAYHSGTATMLSRLLWMDRHGGVVGTAGDKDAYWDVELSPNQQKILVPIGDPQREIWIADIGRGTRTKSTVNGGWANNASWGPDGKTIYIDLLRQGKVELVAQQIGGGGARTLLTRAKDFYAPRAVTPDGKSLFMETTGMIERLPLNPPGAPVAITRKGIIALMPAISADGKWLAYMSNENGRNEVFVVSLTDDQLKWQVSANGGICPRWRRDGKEIFFVDLTGHVNAATVTESGNGLDFGPPQPLFAANFRPTTRAYDVTADGQKFLVNVIADEESPTVVVLNDWKTRLPR